MKLTRRWVVAEKKSDDLVEQLLINRAINPKEGDAFLSPDYERDLHDPLKMKGMEEAVERIIKAIKNKEKIVIWGDYDADGTPGAALLADFFAQLDFPVTTYIPTREEGYGLNKEGVDRLAKEKTKLLITVDCGIRNATEIDYAKSQDLETIVLDHHLPPGKLPEAILLDPKQPGDFYPFKELCGAGVAFKLVQALTVRASQLSKSKSEEELRKFLKWEMDLVGLATLVDMVPLIGENRVIARFGLITLKKTRRLGLKMLYEVAGIDPTTINTYTASFMIGPRLNAAGRLDHASQSFYLLTEADPHRARAMAIELNDLNRRRQEVLDKALREAREQVEKEKLHQKKIIVVGNPKWHQGIIGLVAGKLMEEYARPTLVFSQGKIRSKGSARSIEAFHIVEALDHCQKVLLKYGGHAQAAGLTIETRHLSALYDKLLEYAERKLTKEDLMPTIAVDAALPLDKVNHNLYETIAQFEPYGIGNPRPQFIAYDCLVQSARAVGEGGRHLKMMVGGKDAIAFDLGELAHEIMAGDVIDIVYSIDRDTWNGRSRVQLKVLDLKKSGLE